MASRTVIVASVLVFVFMAAAFVSLWLQFAIPGLVFVGLVPLTAMFAIIAWAQSTPRRRP